MSPASSIQVSEEMADYPAKIYLEPACTVNFERRWSTGQFEKCSEEGCDDCNNNDGAYVLAMRAKEPLAQGDAERLVKIAFEGAIWNCIMSRQMLDQDTTDEIITGAWEGFEEPFRAALVRPISDDVRERVARAIADRIPLNSGRFLPWDERHQEEREPYLEIADAVLAIGSQSIEGERAPIRYAKPDGRIG